MDATCIFSMNHEQAVQTMPYRALLCTLYLLIYLAITARGMLCGTEPRDTPLTGGRYLFIAMHWERYTWCEIFVGIKFCDSNWPTKITKFRTPQKLLAIRYIVHRSLTGPLEINDYFPWISEYDMPIPNHSLCFPDINFIAPLCSAVYLPINFSHIGSCVYLHLQASLCWRRHKLYYANLR